jgi:hypothetical protein
MPNPRVIFHSDDWYLIPFTLLWGGFAIFWTLGVAGFWGEEPGKGHPWTFGIIGGLAFVAVGQYIIWGRFLVDAWSKRRTYYAVTNRRVLIVQEAWKRKTRSSYLEGISEIQREGATTGTLWLGEKLPILGGRAQPTRSMSRFDMGDGVPVLADIDDVDSVDRLIMELREKARKETIAGQG